MVKSLAEQVPATTLVDLPPTLLQLASSSLTIARNVACASVLAPYMCLECSRPSQVSIQLAEMIWPASLADAICATCGGITRSALPPEVLAPLEKVGTFVSDASAKVVEHRTELLSRAQTDAKVARAVASGAPVAAEDAILGKYKIVRALSAGGMAEVFLAKQIGLDKPVAIKRIQNKLLESRQQAIQLFLNEAKIAGRLMHPNIAQVLDVGEANGALYLAMEFVHGKDLREVIKALKKRGRTMPMPEALYIVREVALALDYAYWSTDLAGKRLNVVHRDVSPHNVILGYDGTVKLIDFGVAMSAITEHEQSLIVGKWTYMAPEATTNGKADHRSDLFSLGVILYNLCSGAMPFSGPDPKEIVRKIRAGEHRRLEEISPQVPPRLAGLVSRMLSPSPEQRPLRGQEVVHELVEMTRDYGLESSSSRIAEFLGGMFPRAVQPTTDHPVVKEIVRVYPDGDADSIQPTQISQRVSSSLLSITPSARTSRAPLTSETFPRVTDSFRRVRDSSAPPLTMSPMPRPRAQAPDVEKANLRDTIVNLTIALTILAVVVLGTYLILSNS
jgi:serine/threonine protein kinase